MFLRSFSAAATTVVLATLVATSARAAAVTGERGGGGTERPVDAVRAGALAGVGFPRALEIEPLVQVEERVAVGLEYSAMPKITVAHVDTTMWALDGDLRVFPFVRGPFFVGVRGGRQHVASSTTQTVAGAGTFTGSAALDTWFVNPRAGMLWRFASGVAVGLDAGVQIPLSSSFSSDLPPPVLAAAPGIETAARSLGGQVLPTLDLLRLGLLL